MRTIVLIDGQNLYHLARLAWAPVPVDRSSVYSWPSYDVELLAAHLVARLPQRELSEVRFYTGVPAPSVNRFWHDFWTNRWTSPGIAQAVVGLQPVGILRPVT